MKTSPSLRLPRILMTASVKVSQPWPEWLLACPARTVRHVLSRNTPCLAQRVRLPVGGMGLPVSAAISWKIFLS